MKSTKLIGVSAVVFAIVSLVVIPARLTAQDSQATIFVKGTFQNGAALSGNLDQFPSTMTCRLPDVYFAHSGCHSSGLDGQLKHRNTRFRQRKETLFA